jgi:hypothetical protein
MWEDIGNIVGALGLLILLGILIYSVNMAVNSFHKIPDPPVITYGHKYKVIDGFYKGCTGYALVPKDYSVILDGTICGNTKPGAIEVDNRYLAEIAE